MDAAVYAVGPIDRRSDGRHERAYGAANPANAMQASFGAGEVSVRSTSASGWQLALKLKAYGYGDDLVALEAGAMRAQGNRIEIDRHAAGAGLHAARVAGRIS